MNSPSPWLQTNYRIVFFNAYGDFPHPCYFCGEEVDGHVEPRDDKRAVIHHVDHDPKNNVPENLVPAHKGCHEEYHRASPETRQKMRESARRRWDSEAGRAEAARHSLRMTGRTASEETRAKMSAASKGKPKSVRHRRNIAAARKGKPSPFQGQHSEEAKERMKAAFAKRPKEPCPHCGQTFTTNILARHVPSCKRKLEEEPQLRRKSQVQLSPNQQAEVYGRWQAGERQVTLATEYGVSQPYISTIVRRLAEENNCESLPSTTSGLPASGRSR